MTIETEKPSLNRTHWPPCVEALSNRQRVTQYQRYKMLASDLGLMVTANQ